VRTRWHMRPFASERDYWLLRPLLRESYRLNGRLERSWQVYRWDYCHWHVYPTVIEQPAEDAVLIWESPAGEPIAALLSEAWGDVTPQVHPAWRCEALEREMILAAEEHLSAPRGEGRALTLWAHADDPLRRGILQERGYEPWPGPEHQRWQDLPVARPAPGPPAGYALRSLGGPEDLPARVRASWLAFHPGDPYGDDDPSWYPERIQRAPLYRRDLDLVAVAPDGSLAGFATIWYDDVTRAAAFEPVGVAPEHRRRGLGRALMEEGLRRAQWMGATRAHVASYGAAAHATYASVGFTRYHLCERWQRTWEPADIPTDASPR